jgi:hypothetical protein
LDGRRTVGDNELRFPVVDVLKDLAQIAHIEPLAAFGAFHVMVGLGLSDAVRVDTRFRHGRYISRFSFRGANRAPSDL